MAKWTATGKMSTGGAKVTVSVEDGDGDAAFWVEGDAFTAKTLWNGCQSWLQMQESDVVPVSPQFSVPAKMDQPLAVLLALDAVLGDAAFEGAVPSMPADVEGQAY